MREVVTAKVTTVMSMMGRIWCFAVGVVDCRDFFSSFQTAIWDLAFPDCIRAGDVIWQTDMGRCVYLMEYMSPRFIQAKYLFCLYLLHSLDLEFDHDFATLDCI